MKLNPKKINKSQKKKIYLDMIPQISMQWYMGKIKKQLKRILQLHLEEEEEAY